MAMPAMAPLYKRYIPPKAAPITTAQDPVAAGPPPPSSIPPSPIPRDVQLEEPPKRKRERTEEQVAERKAKKLRKKGIDPADVGDTASINDQQFTSKAPQKGAVSTQTNGDLVASPLPSSLPPAQGDFSHVRDSKKRHKLEKEARKARIAAEKQSKAGATKDKEFEELEAGQDAAEEVQNTADAVGDATATSDGNSLPAKRKKRRKGQGDDEGEYGVAPVKANHATQPAEDENELRRAQAMHPGAEFEGGDDQPYDTRLSQPKKRRHRLESVLLGNGRRTDDVDEFDHLKKHDNVVGKYKKAQKQAESGPTQYEVEEANLSTQQPVLRDLVPLPQPERAQTPEFVPDPNALPSWLAKPTVIEDDRKSTFTEMGLDTRLTQHLSKLGFEDALPVQQALVPLLLPPSTPGARFLPGTKSVVPDLAVGAPTGSGKTIAYLLPMVEAIKQSAGSGKLKALVVVPTRELVMQVAAVAESLAKGSRVKVGVATGTGSLEDERSRLVSKDCSYDVTKYHGLMAKARRLSRPPLEHPSAEWIAPVDDTDDRRQAFNSYLDDIESLDAREKQLLRDVVSELQGYVPSYESAVDILVATPGRLLEHVDNTLGFSLIHIDWLVLDEADKLLDGQYSNFLQVITSMLDRTRNEDEQDARERYLRACGRWNESAERRVRKVVLSATMTRDVSKLMGLKLKRPQMVLVRGNDDLGDHSKEDLKANTTSFELPHTLREYSVHTGDGSEKPLFLMRVLSEHILRDQDHVNANDGGVPARAPEGSDAFSSTDSDASSSGSASDSESASSDGSSSDSDESSEAVDHRKDEHTTNHPSRAVELEHDSTAPAILIFTSSTESASRLSHLLTSLLPPQTSLLTLTSTTPSKILAKRLTSTPPTQSLLAITTDRAARGLDALGSRTITHVVQYDVPRSATNYIHRVGRTARAGRAGEAWTLFTHVEAKWFVSEVVQGAGLKRRAGSAGVEKVKISVDGDEELRERFRSAIEGLREGVLSDGRKRRQ